MQAATLLLWSFFGVVWCRSLVTDHGTFSTDRLSPEDREWLARHSASHRSSALPSNFHIIWLSQPGIMLEQRNHPGGDYIRIAGSPQTNKSSLYLAAYEITKMMKHVPSHVFSNLSSHGAGVGVFTAAEKLSVYPEYARLKDTPQCHGRCDGNCGATCTFDGRKWDTTAGAGGLTATILIDNILCNAHDPYSHHDNIMIHEFAHTTENYGLSYPEKYRVKTAFNNAKQHHLWNPDSYAQTNEQEYFAEATGSYFYVNLQSSSGGMTKCSGRTCSSEAEVRRHLHSQDPQLFSLLQDIWSGGDSTLPGGLTVCPT